MWRQEELEVAVRVVQQPQEETRGPNFDRKLEVLHRFTFHVYCCPRHSKVKRLTPFLRALSGREVDVGVGLVL